MGGEASLCFGEERDWGWACVSVPLAMGPLDRGGETIMGGFVEEGGSCEHRRKDETREGNATVQCTVLLPSVTVIINYS